MQVFEPRNTNAIAATATSQNRLFPTFTGGGAGDCCAYYNDGPGIVFIVTGAVGVTATLPALSAAAGAQGNATPIPVGQSVNITHKAADTSWAAICPAGVTANVYCTPGVGV